MSVERARELNQLLLEVRREQRSAEHRMAGLLAEVVADKHFHKLGYATVYDYASAVLGLGRRQTRALAALGRGLAALPALDAAFEAGTIGWTKAREVLRVATPETVEQWVDFAAGTNSRALEHAVSHSSKGDLPPPAELECRRPARRRLVFELEGPEADFVEQALTWVKTQAALDDDELDRGAALTQLLRRALESAQAELAPSSERYRIHIQTCPSCVETHGLDSEASDTLCLEAGCDAELVQLEGDKPGTLTRTVPPATRRFVLARDRSRCVVPGCHCALWLDIHHVNWTGAGRTHHPHNLVTLCSTHHRLLHDGHLAVERLATGGLQVRFADGRCVQTDPRGAVTRHGTGTARRCTPSEQVQLPEPRSPSPGWGAS